MTASLFAIRNPRSAADPFAVRTHSLDAHPAVEPMRTLTIEERIAITEQSAMLVNQAWVLRADSTDLHDQVVNGHAHLLSETLEQRAQDRAREGALALLDELADGGFAWVDIARLVGVSVPAVRKWRNGGTISGERLADLARVVVLVDWLRDENHVTDVASWLEVPISPDAPVTRMDVLQSGDRDLLIRSLVGDGLAPTDMLDEFQPDWRATYNSEFEVFDAADGERSIRSKQS